MFGLRSPRSVVTSLTVITFSLLTGIASAQTPTITVDKPVAELSTSIPKAASNVAAPVLEETVKPATESPKVEAESVKPETTTPASTTTTAPAAAMQQCTRTVKADIVAIPKALMLNRLGATIPNAF